VAGAGRWYHNIMHYTGYGSGEGEGSEAADGAGRGGKVEVWCGQ
jgi:hypothetical protein